MLPWRAVMPETRGRAEVDTNLGGEAFQVHSLTGLHKRPICSELQGAVSHYALPEHATRAGLPHGAHANFRRTATEEATVVGFA